MKQIKAWQLLDGSLFDDKLHAAKLADARYQNLLCALANGLYALKTQEDTKEYIETHIERFIDLANLKRDSEELVVDNE